MSPGSLVPILWIVIPFYNEAATLEECVSRVVASQLPMSWSKGLVLVDDHSRDQTAGESGYAAALVERLRTQGHVIDLIRHEINCGKGAAVRTGFDRVLAKCAENDAVIIQDADLEYDPADYASLLEPIIAGNADAVFGTRWGEHFQPSGTWRRVHVLGNRMLTRFSNFMTGYRITDMECCYKVLTIPVLRLVQPMMTEDRFGVEPQLAAALARIKARLVERPVRYDPRGVESGKKIGGRDALRAIWVMLRERFQRGRRI